MFLNKLSYVFIGMILCIFVVLSYPVLTNLSFFDIDDLRSTLSPYSLLYEENGRYVCNIISRIFMLYIPNWFNIHLQNFVNTGGAFLYFIILILLFVRTAVFVKISDKNNFLFSLLLILPFLLFCQHALYSHPLYSLMVTYQYGYVLATVFGLWFLYKIYDFIFNKKVLSQKDMITTSIIAFCAGNSSQIVCYSTAITLFSLISLYLFFNIKKIDVKQIIINNKYTIIPVAFFFTGMALMILSPGFWKEVSWRHAHSFEQVVSIFIPFIQNLYEYIVLRVSFYLKIILALIVVIIIISFFTKQTKENLYKVLVSLFPIIGVLGYYFTLILAGETFPDPNLKFWIYEPFYFYYLLMIIGVTICLLIGILFNSMKQIFWKILVVLIILVLFLYNALDSFSRYKDYLSLTKQTRKDMYICDKYLVSQIELEKDIILPNFCNNYNIYHDINGYLKPVYGVTIPKYPSYKEDGFACQYLKEHSITINEAELNKPKFKHRYIEK